jgi:glutaryl-CoA dehydrogenase
MSATAMPYEHLGHALATDYFLVRETFSDEQWERFLATRRLVDDEVLPVINDYWERADLPWPLLRRLAELGVVGEGIDGYGCPAMSPLARGLVHMEVNRGAAPFSAFRAGWRGRRSTCWAPRRRRSAGCRRWRASRASARSR